MYGYESWTMKKAERHKELMILNYCSGEYS